MDRKSGTQVEVGRKGVVCEAHGGTVARPICLGYCGQAGKRQALD